MSAHLREAWRKLGFLQDYLQQLADMKRNPRTEHWVYGSIEEMVLKEGKPYTWAPLPEDICSGEMGQCYSNAMQMVQDDPGGLTYVEGYAASTGLGVPMSHGWGTDGVHALDPTWPEGGEYFGIPFNFPWWMTMVAKNGYWGLFWGDDFLSDSMMEVLENGLPPGAVA